MNEIVPEALGQITIRNSNPKLWPFELLQVCNIFRFFIQNSNPKPTNAWLFPIPLAAIWNSSYSRCCRTIFGVNHIRWYGLRRKLPDWQNFLRHYTTKRRVRMFSSVNATGYIEKKKIGKFDPQGHVSTKKIQRTRHDITFDSPAFDIFFSETVL